MVEAFRVFRAPSDAMYGHGILASGLVARMNLGRRCSTTFPN